MTSKQQILEIVTAILQDNVGNRLTVCLANGMLHQIGADIDKNAPVLIKGQDSEPDPRET